MKTSLRFTLDPTQDLGRNQKKNYVKILSLLTRLFGICVRNLSGMITTLDKDHGKIKTKTATNSDR
jgi:hypothetical protein